MHDGTAHAHEYCPSSQTSLEMQLTMMSVSCVPKCACVFINLKFVLPARPEYPHPILFAATHVHHHFQIHCDPPLESVLQDNP